MANGPDLSLTKESVALKAYAPPKVNSGMRPRHRLNDTGLSLWSPSGVRRLLDDECELSVGDTRLRIVRRLDDVCYPF